MKSLGFLMVVGGIWLVYQAWKQFSPDTAQAASSAQGPQGTLPAGGTQPGSASQAQGPAQAGASVGAASGGRLPFAPEIANWANSNASRFGVNAHDLAVSLLALNAYESPTGAAESSAPGSGRGPFQLTGQTRATAEAAGFDVSTATGSLNAFAASGDMTAGVRALASGLARGEPLSEAAHDMELAMERPKGSVDAGRVARGDWNAAFTAAEATLFPTSNPNGVGTV